ncbi:hypothetical protein [Dactylosporangium sp. CA-233914]|uniref:hypothetical protein n=1 Tax=Dactylosporangium sp. CA-233914 TaxID=3239934 RepID=UPI003D9265B5
MPQDIKAVTSRKFLTYRDLSKLSKIMASVGLDLGAIPLFPWGIVALLFVVAGKSDMSWFLAAYLPAPWSLPAAGYDAVRKRLLGPSKAART